MRRLKALGEALGAPLVMAPAATVDMETLHEVAVIKSQPEFQAFIAVGGLASVVGDARKKFAAWEKDGLLGDQSSGQ